MVREAAGRPDIVTVPEAFSIALQHHQSGRLAEAETLYRQILAVAPQHVDSLHLLGVIEHQAGRCEAGAAWIRKAIALAPGVSIFHSNLGAALGGQGKLVEAVAEYRRALELNPDDAKAHNNLATTLKDLGFVGEGIAGFRRAIALDPGYTVAHSSLLLTLHYLAGAEAGMIFREHRVWDEAQAAPLAKFIAPHGNERDPERRLRVGYVSPDFREHPVAYFFEALLAAHDRAQVEVFCYSDTRRVDDVMQRLRRGAAQWREIFGMADEKVAALIREDGIDILVDLAGHTAHNRLLVFARKPAPVQVSWLGYCDTTGLGAMDYRITDAHADPPGMTEHWHTEKLVRLTETFVCFRPSDLAPPVGGLPALALGKVTFGSFHTLAKLNEPLLERWAAILKAVPGSRLLLVATGLDEASSQRRLAEFFGRHGVPAERLTFRGRQSLEGYFALHAEMDVLLDSDPFTGHTVSCHALWMGLPVVTLSGVTHCSRMVTSVLKNVGCPEWIATTPDEYVTIATALASDLPKLAETRAGLRAKMAASPLTDARSFAKHIEQAYRRMWRAWCAGSQGKGAP